MTEQPIVRTPERREGDRLSDSGADLPAGAVNGDEHVLRTLWEALRGAPRDIRREPLRRAVILLAVPMVLEMAMESIFAVTDIFWVSRLGAEATAAVGLTESLMTMVYTVAIGLSIGVTAVVARRVGEGDEEAAGRVAFQAILLGLGLSVAIGIGGALYAEELLRLMGATDGIVDIGRGYATLMLGANGVILLLFMNNAAFRGAGDAAIAMRVLWLANGINIVLDPLLIFGVGPFPEMGVTGAAVATTIGRGTGVLLQFATLAWMSGTLRIRREHMAIRIDIMGRVLRLSATGTLQTFIGTASYIGLMRVLAEFGATALAGYVIAIRIVLFALLPAWGLGNAAATLVGQALGSGDPDRAERAAWIAARINLAFLGSIGLLFVVAAGPIVAAFGGDAETARYATTALRIISLGFVFYSFGMVLTQAFNGAGDAWTPTLLNLICFWLWEIPLAWTLAFPLGLGPLGAFWAITIAFSTLAVLATVVFRRGRWKNVVV